MTLPRVVADLPVAQSVHDTLGGRVELVPWSYRGPAAALYTYGHPRVDGATLDALPGLKVVSNFGVGVDHIDLKAAAARGIPVGNTPGILNGATADLTFALVLAAGRRVVEGDRYARGPHFTVYDPSYMIGREVHSSTLGIFGMGRIGRQVAQRARGFDMTVLYHNRTRDEAAENEFAAVYVTKEQLLRAADYVVLTVPLTPETRALIGAHEFALMKPTAVLVNVARGPVVDADALTEALKAKRIFAAALDVTDPEPLPRDHPLLALDNVIITPHLGSASAETRQRMADLAAANLFAGLAGKPLPHPVGAG